MDRRRSLMGVSESSGNIIFPATLVEGNNGQIGIDVYNYLYTNYPDTGGGTIKISETIIINNGSLESKIGDTIVYVMAVGDAVHLYGKSGSDCYVLLSNGYMYAFDD